MHDEAGTGRDIGFQVQPTDASATCIGNAYQQLSSE